MEKGQCSAGSSPAYYLPQWAILKISLAKLGCSRLQEAALTNKEAEVIIERVACNTHRYLIQALSKSEFASNFPEIQKDLVRFDNIDEYLQEKISYPGREENPNSWQVFEEDFHLPNIYVPQKVKPVDKNGNEDDEADTFDLEGWVKGLLSDPHKQDKVIFIQGEPGRGKSVFCRMFADWVLQHLHPIWTPILIRLRDIDELKPNLKDTLRDAVHYDFASNDEGWLTDKNTRFLFLLDGFDELVLQRGAEGLKGFFDKVDLFQRACNSPDMGHRVIVTGRTLALQSVEQQLKYLNLERVIIQPMDDSLRDEWFKKWSALVEVSKSLEFSEFLNHDSCPVAVREELAREPLLLYLLAAMHRDGHLSLQNFGDAKGIAAKILVYQKCLDWVLEEQRQQGLNQRLTRLEKEGLERILGEAALCVVQSGRQFAAVSAIEKRLKNDTEVLQLIQQARATSSDETIRNALATFFLHPAKEDRRGSVEFVHRIFSEFLFAKRLKQGLRKQIISSQIAHEEVANLDWEIYDLLGYGALTLEIVEYLMGLIVGEIDPARLVQLFKRLEAFYFRWSKRDFIDTEPLNLPQRKMMELREQLQTTVRGQRQVDIYTGLNVMIMLLELHRYVQSKDDLKDKIAFYPCGKKDIEGFDERRFYRIINYSNYLGLKAFLSIAGSFLSGANLKSANLKSANLKSANLKSANLSGADLIGANLISANLISADLISADLRRVNLRRVNLRSANLSGANLISADLSGANLSGANLISADLISADLSGTDLSGANLSGTDLSGANLSGANLNGAKLRSANLSGADLRGANLRGVDLRSANLSGANLSNQYLGSFQYDENTKWDVRGLETVSGLPEDFKQQLGL